MTQRGDTTDVAGGERHRATIARTSFIGRQPELQALVGWLGQGRSLLTLIGPGGVGKTRLAIEMIKEASIPCDAVVVELATLTAAEDVLGCVTHALVGGRAQRSGAESPEAEIINALRDREVLLVMDNCDLVLAGCATLVEEILAYCPGVRVLATSREALGVEGETVFVVPPLALPPPSTRDPAALSECESVRLFVKRAQAASPSFELSDNNASYVAQICRRLDGLPLAIELAAARVRVLSPHQIAARLDHRFDLLRDQRRPGPQRHRTMQAAVLWSYRLLPEVEQTLLNRLSVFAGGATITACERICTGGAVRRDDLLDSITALVDKSFVIVDWPPSGDARYRLLETIREFATEALGAAREKAELEEKHAAWIEDLVETTEAALWGPKQRAWLARLSIEHENLRAVIERSMPAEPQRALRIAARIWRYCELSGRLTEGAAWLARAMIAVGDTGTDPLSFARAAFGAGYLARDRGDFVAARALFEKSLQLFQAAGARQDVGSALRSIALIEEAEGNRAHAQRLLEEALTLFRELGHELGVGWTLRNLGTLALARGNEDEALAAFREAMPILRSLGDLPGIARTLGSLAVLARLRQDFAAADSDLEQALALVREAGDQRGVAMMLAALGTLAYRQGATALASARLRESLDISHRADDSGGIAVALAMLGVLAVDRRDYAGGLSAIVSAAQCDRGLWTRLAGDEQVAVQVAQDSAQTALGAQADSVAARAQRLSREERFRLGAKLADDDTGERVATQPTGLTPRQIQVLRLIARGMTNREIGTELGLSEYTVMRHVSNLFDRIGVSSRVAAVTWASNAGVLERLDG